MKNYKFAIIHKNYIRLMDVREGISPLFEDLIENPVLKKHSLGLQITGKERMYEFEGKFLGHKWVKKGLKPFKRIYHTYTIDEKIEKKQK